MLEFSVGKTKIKISFLFLAFCTICSLCDKRGFFTMALFASLLHEMAHILMLYFVGESAEKLDFVPQGIALVRKGKILSYKSEILILSAGCILNFILFLIFYFCCQTLSLKLFGVVNLGLGLFNALPIGALDGGRILKILLKNMFFAQKAELICKIVSVFIVVVFILLGIYLVLNGRRNVSLLLTCIYLTSMLLFRNYD